MTSARLRRLLDSHEIEALAAPDEEVAGFWRKALRAYRDSRLPGLSPASGFNLAYEAALDVATALVREAGFRVKTSRAHPGGSVAKETALHDEVEEWAESARGFAALETVVSFPTRPAARPGAQRRDMPSSVVAVRRCRSKRQPAPPPAPSEHEVLD